MAIEFSVLDGIALVRINRPQALNALDGQTRRDLQDAWRQIARDDSVRVTILTGMGEKAFCTGSDLKLTGESQETLAQATLGPLKRDHLLSGFDTEKPVIAAINGYAIGGGLELALAADIRIAAEHARFALTEARIGSIPGAGGTQRLPRLVGSSNALMMMLTGDQIDAAEALRIGLISKIISKQDLMSAAQEIAAKICRSAPLSVRAIKRLVRDGVEQPLNAAIDMERLMFGVLRDSEDRREGRAAFREKRQPIFKGC